MNWKWISHVCAVYTSESFPDKRHIFDVQIMEPSTLGEGNLEVKYSLRFRCINNSLSTEPLKLLSRVQCLRQTRTYFLFIFPEKILTLEFVFLFSATNLSVAYSLRCIFQCELTKYFGRQYEPGRRKFEMKVFEFLKAWRRHSIQKTFKFVKTFHVLWQHSDKIMIQTLFSSNLYQWTFRIIKLIFFWNILLELPNLWMQISGKVNPTGYSIRDNFLIVAMVTGVVVQTLSLTTLFFINSRPFDCPL